MNHCRVEVCVIGSGFAGSLLAMMLAREGRSVAMIERGQHPRFAIGESSTPLANFKLRQIAKKHDLPQLESFTRYGDWREQHPELMRGPKRGFSYFGHRQGHAFETDDKHSGELMVTANSNLNGSDLHWLRADIDAFLVEEAIRAGVVFLDETTIRKSLITTPDSAVGDDGWVRWVGERKGKTISLDTHFTIIASGNPQVWQDAIDVPPANRWPRTHSRSLFAHFKDVEPWNTIMIEDGFGTAEHPFDCDQSALHHVFDGGWMWQLRFDDGTTSAGFMIDSDRFPLDASESGESEWRRWLDRFPSIRRQFGDAMVVRPQTGLQRTGRLQQSLRKVAGERWALLPAAVGFSDPLFSTGIGHALFAVDRLVLALRDLDDSQRLRKSLAVYANHVDAEIDLIDRLVSLAYRASSSFENYVTATMPYFAAATSCERSARTSAGAAMPSFLLADDVSFLHAINVIEQAHRETLAGHHHQSFTDSVREALEPFNHVGLFSPDRPRMYRYTTAD